MRKIAALALVLVVGVAQAQPVSKKGEIYTPEAGDIGFGIDAAPFLDYFGNLFTPDNQAPDVNFSNSNFAISGRKFVRADFAWRASARLNVESRNQVAYSPEFSIDPTNLTVEDSYNRSITNFFFSLGVEKRRGKGRVQGYYGVEGLLGLGTESHRFDYGNQISQENPAPTRTDFDLLFQDGSTGVTSVTDEGAYLTRYKLGTAFTIGARGFVGAEVFVFPKMSLGVELGLTADVTYRGNGEILTEQWTVPPGGNAEQIVLDVTDTGNTSQFGIDTDNANGRIFLFFYF